jgi:hypothetical protein
LSCSHKRKENLNKDHPQQLCLCLSLNFSHYGHVLNPDHLRVCGHDHEIRDGGENGHVRCCGNPHQHISPRGGDGNGRDLCGKSHQHISPRGGDGNGHDLCGKSHQHTFSHCGDVNGHDHEHVSHESDHVHSLDRRTPWPWILLQQQPSKQPIYCDEWRKTFLFQNFEIKKLACKTEDEKFHLTNIRHHNTSSRHGSQHVRGRS